MIGDSIGDLLEENKASLDAGVRGLVIGNSEDITRSEPSPPNDKTILTPQDKTETHTNDQELKKTRSCLIISLHNLLDSCAHTFGLIFTQKYVIRTWFYWHLWGIALSSILIAFYVWITENSNCGISLFDSWFTAVTFVTQTGNLNFDWTRFYSATQGILSLFAVLTWLTSTAIPLMITKIIFAYYNWYQSSKNPAKTDEMEVYKIKFYAELLHMFLIQAITHVTALIFSVCLGVYLTTRYTSTELSNMDPYWLAMQLTYSAWANFGIVPYSDGLMRFRYDNVFLIYINVVTLLGITLFPMMCMVTVNFGSIMFGKSLLGLIFRFMHDNHHHFSLFLYPGVQTVIYCFLALLNHFVGTFFYFFVEWNNPDFQSDWFNRLMIASSLSVSSRSGFYLVNLLGVSQFTLILMCIQMRLKPQMMTSLADQFFHDDLEAVAANEKALQRLNGIIENAKLKTLRVEKTVIEESILMVENFLGHIYSIWKILKNSFLTLIKDHNVWILIATGGICLIEKDRMVGNPNISFLSVLFEVLGCFGNVGASIGHPGYSTGLSTVLSPVSSVILCLIMFLGKHRGLRGGVLDQTKKFKYETQSVDELKNKPVEILL